MAYNKSNPFDWGNTEPATVTKEEGEKDKFNTIPTQRNASYTEVPEEQFTNTALDSFMENIEAPTPQLKKICGIECPNA